MMQQLCQEKARLPCHLPSYPTFKGCLQRIDISGDFSKRISLIMVQRLDGSEYPTWATQDGVPSGSRSPAWLFCSVQCPFHIPCGSAPRPDGCLSTSYSWPIPA